MRGFAEDWLKVVVFVACVLALVFTVISIIEFIDRPATLEITTWSMSPGVVCYTYRDDLECLLLTPVPGQPMPTPGD